ncbi:hypothetical protein BDN72DRAFT_834491 [Pluteus cervinus]|uniref:Uncharacterized protein n=1 Tax=Pluteus cervinus TaxID=181527 RepID=A0ACD3B6K1_9AGAR|nr:hypothetical protein BDN72DRAFT_834491 [Pluteus cervinus]
MHFAALAIGVLLLGSQAVLSTTFKFKFSQVEQCEPVSITIIGDTPSDDIPTTLTILPFNSQPVSIPIPNAMANTSSISVSFLPLPVNTTFIATLDNSEGFSATWVSDIMRVQPSNNNACLSSAPVASTQKTFTLASEPSQCEALTVKYDTTRVRSAPNVRLFSPFGPAFLLNMTSDNPTRGMATYLINFFRGKEIILLFDGGVGEQETSDLITILGDTSSSGKCIFNELQNNAAPPSTTPASKGLSKDIVIGLSVGGGVIILISAFMVFYILRERRRRRFQITFDPAMLEKRPYEPETLEYQPYQGTIPRPPRSIPSSIRESFVQDPPYTERQYLEARRTSTSSWSPVLPRDHETGAENEKPPISYGSRLSLNSLDIEGMLNIVAAHSNRSSRQDPVPLGLVQQVSSRPPQAILRPFPGRRRDRNPSDVPRGPTSMMSISSNPFSDENTITPPEARLQTNHSLMRPSLAIPDLNGDPILSSPSRPSIAAGDRNSPNFGIAR